MKQTEQVPDVPEQLRVELNEYLREDALRLVGLLERWPNFRLHIGYASLGCAVAVADSLGCDAEGFIAELRRLGPKPPVLEPPNPRRTRG